MPFDKDAHTLHYSAIFPPVHYLEREDFVYFKDPEPIELISTTDQYTHLRSGAKGKATGWNKQPGENRLRRTYTLLVEWDDGSSMGLVYGEDKWKVVKNE